MFNLKFIILCIFSAMITNYLLDLYHILPENNYNVTTYKIFTSQDLENYNGVDGTEIYLSLLGNVFDVTKGARHYGPGKPYHTFVGCDNSKNFVIGNLDKFRTSDDVLTLSQSDLRSLENWLEFYDKEYKRVGKLIGRYYDKNGHSTAYGHQVKVLIKAAKEQEVENYLEKLKIPPCNVEWDPMVGSRVWCTKKSGGIERDWIGVPRKLYEIGSQNYRCACVHKSNENLGILKEYDGCDSSSISCFDKNI